MDPYIALCKNIDLYSGNGALNLEKLKLYYLMRTAQTNEIKDFCFYLLKNYSGKRMSLNGNGLMDPMILDYISELETNSIKKMEYQWEILSKYGENTRSFGHNCNFYQEGTWSMDKIISISYNLTAWQRNYLIQKINDSKFTALVKIGHAQKLIQKTQFEEAKKILTELKAKYQDLILFYWHGPGKIGDKRVIIEYLIQKHLQEINKNNYLTLQKKISFLQ